MNTLESAALSTEFEAGNHSSEAILSLGVVLARASSTRLKQKPLRTVSGTPLVAWVSAAAINSKLSRIFVSTESKEIAELAQHKKLIEPTLRPSELARDFAADADIVLWSLEQAEKSTGLKFATVTVMQSSSPFVSSKHINVSLQALSRLRVDCVMSVRKAREYPEWMWERTESGALLRSTTQPLSAEQQHSQNLRTRLYPSGALWTIRSATLRSEATLYPKLIGAVELDYLRSLDIDDADDLAYGEFLVKRFDLKPEGVLQDW